MPDAHFIKVRDNMHWKDIVRLAEAVRSKGCKPIPYNIIAKVTLAPSEFELLTGSLSHPNHNYLQYTSKSIPTKNGVWNCISMRKRSSNVEILLYTAGRTFPLYFAVN
jgi:hypothetical protein